MPGKPTLESLKQGDPCLVVGDSPNCGKQNRGDKTNATNPQNYTSYVKCSCNRNFIH
jgi:hypothetical protein